MGQRHTKKDSSNQKPEETQQTCLDIVDCFDILDDYVYIETWQNIDLSNENKPIHNDNNDDKKDLKEIADEMEKQDFSSTEQEMSKCIKDCYLFLKESERESFREAIYAILLHGNFLIEIGEMGVELFKDIFNQVNQESYVKRMTVIHDHLKLITHPRYRSTLESSVNHIENILRAKAKKYFWACIILGIVSLVGLVGLGIAAITTFIGAFVGVPIVAGVGVAMAVGCSVAIPVAMNSCLKSKEVSSFADKWEDKLMQSREYFGKIMDSEEVGDAKKTTATFETGNQLPKIEDCEQLIRIFNQLRKYGKSLKECVY
ncbi:predicted protein [Naegleria gruberi]|uniref:Predicted protein n=1 Tax=Naegleria gruberi TaxID=5762 RepID=D2V9F2_NAEGR|nr:uncharacterized protein NAEGRDRAFT_47681 [Naegleria gruberi]EFC46579.1 predicted protein [Naegleria gruberi]|eukprot:XP_002679323.1 predicted protein [Naegleria gruberi strain NEG-M]